jgi:hypothetical protein
MGRTSFVITGTNVVGSSSITYSLAVVGPAARISLSRASIGTARSTNFTTQPQVTIEDAGGTRNESSTATVIATLSGPGGLLIGNTSVNAVDGVATFSDLAVDGTIGESYTLTYSSGSLISASSSFRLSGKGCLANDSMCRVGDIGPGGGIIFYVADTTFVQAGAIGSMCSDQCKYLEAAPATWSGGVEDPSLTWATGANTELSVAGSNSPAIGAGFQNTLDIVAQSGNVAESSAAVAAFAYRGGGFADWYLPSREETYALGRRNRTLVELKVSGEYWSSNQFGGMSAVGLRPSGLDLVVRKSIENLVRPIRAIGPVTLSLG